MPAQFWPQYYTTTATATTTNTVSYAPQVWQTWVNQASTITSQYYTTVSTDQIWVNWVIQSPNVGWATPQYSTYSQESAEQRAERERVHVERERERQAARTRARLLLGEFLDDEQKLELERKGRFHVTGSRGRRYCIRAEGQAGNVDLLKPDGSLQAKLCCHPRQGLPDGDAWLMQMIEIRHDEDHFLATANIHRGTLPVAA